MLTIIEIKDREDGGHGLQSQSHRTECWLEGWLAVPPELEQTAWDCAGYCDLDIQDGKLVGLTPREQPPKPEPEPDLTPQFRTAMLSYAATSTAIPDSYALDMSDLFPTWAAVLADGEELPEGRVLNDGGQLYRVDQTGHCGVAPDAGPAGPGCGDPGRGVQPVKRVVSAELKTEERPWYECLWWKMKPISVR